MKTCGIALTQNIFNFLESLFMRKKAFTTNKVYKKTFSRAAFLLQKHDP